MSQDLEACLIRVCDAQGETRGTGFVVSDALAVTCAHVVDYCGVTKGERVRIVFHVNGEGREAQVLPEFWRPSDGDDIAILRLVPGNEPLPDGVVPAMLGSARHCEGHELRTLGFARPGEYEFVRAEGRILGVVTHPQKRPMLQIDAQPVREGMSGAPVLDLNTERVVGVVNELTNVESKTYKPLEWATTADTLNAVCPELRLHLPQAVEDYLRAVAQFCRDLPYVSLRTDVPLEDVYVRQQMRQKPTKRSGEGAKMRDEQGGMWEWRSPPMPLIRALEEHARVVLIGGPGAGKSTQLRHLVQQLAQDSLQSRPYLPILVSLRGLAEKRGDLTTCLREQIGEELGGRLSGPLPENFLIEWAAQTDAAWLIALDALDQIVDGGRRRELIRGLPQATWPTGSRVVVTTRPEQTSASLEGFTPFDLLPFGPEQVQTFAQSWFKNETKADAFLNSLQSARLGELSRTPLFLTIAATVFEITGGTIPRRSRLYDEFVRILLDEDATPNREMRRQFCEQFRTDLGEKLFDYRREVLECVALALQEGQQAHNALASFLREILDWSAGDVTKKAACVMEILLQQRTGLVTQRGDRYEFIHPTFREYLAAATLVRSCRENLQRVWERVVSRWLPERARSETWWQVTLFALGVLSDRGKDVSVLVERIWRKGSLYFAAIALAEQIRVAANLRERIREGLVVQARDKKLIGGVRALAIEALGRLGCLRNLLALARDEKLNGSLSMIAVQELGELRQLNELLTLASDESVDWLVRGEAIKALGELGQMEEVMSVLLALLRDEDEWIRMIAAETLARLGQEEEAVPILVALAQDKDGWTRALAAEALCNLGQIREAAQAWLRLVLSEDEDEWTRERAIGALIELERIDELAMLAFDQNEDEWTRELAAAALNQLQQVDDLLVLAFDENNEDECIRVEIAETLGKLGRAEEACLILLALARDEEVNIEVRDRSIEVLGRLTDADVLPALERIARGDSKASIRGAAREAMKQIRKRTGKP